MSKEIYVYGEYKKTEMDDQISQVVALGNFARVIEEDKRQLEQDRLQKILQEQDRHQRKKSMQTRIDYRYNH